jgi:microcystin degradation protein MlrC
MGDNIGGGTPGDGTVLLAELLRQGAKHAVVVIADREAVEAANRAGVSAEIAVLTSKKCMPGDLQQLRSLGIEPAEQHIIVVKAAIRWRGGYGPITREAIYVDTPGLGSANLEHFSYQSVRRPIFPLDPDTIWSEADR